jgi:hypothetical protein
MRHIAGPVGLLALVAAVLCAVDSFAQQSPAHWLVGTWDSPGGRLIDVWTVRADGTAEGTMGISGQGQGPAEILVEGPRVHIVNSIKNVFDLTMVSDGRMEGIVTNGQTGRTWPWSAAKRERKLCRDSAPADNVRVYGPPDYCALDTWKFSNGRVQTVVKVDDSTVVMANPGVSGPCPACLFTFDGKLTLQRVERLDGTSVDPVAIRSIPIGWRMWDFPMEFKKTWTVFGSQVINPSGGFFRYRVDCRVDAYEDVQTKAGVFKAFRVRRDWSVDDVFGGRGSWRETLWFAPDVKTVVKFTATREFQKDWELLSYNLK